jgi:hypothetical protein
MHREIHPLSASLRIALLRGRTFKVASMIRNFSRRAASTISQTSRVSAAISLGLVTDYFATERRPNDD